MVFFTCSRNLLSPDPRTHPRCLIKWFPAIKTGYSPWFNIVSNRGYTYQFAYQYANSHRSQLSKFNDWQSLERHLIAANWLPDFLQFTESKGIETNQTQLNTSRSLLIRIVNAYIVRDLLGDEGFFPLFERDDDITKRAVQEFAK